MKILNEKAEIIQKINVFTANLNSIDGKSKRKKNISINTSNNSKLDKGKYTTKSSSFED
jgi:hypothetical protein